MASPLGVFRGFVRGASKRPLTAKIGPIGYVKGTSLALSVRVFLMCRHHTFKTKKKQNKTGHGAKATGKHTSKGGYEVDPNKVIDMVVPNLDGFMVAKDETKARKRLIPRVLSSSRTCQGRPGQGV